jgi:hypothetical protein
MENNEIEPSTQQLRQLIGRQGAVIDRLRSTLADLHLASVEQAVLIEELSTRNKTLEDAAAATSEE